MERIRDEVPTVVRHGKAWWTIETHHHRRSSSVHATYTEMVGRSKKAVKHLKRAVGGVGSFTARKVRQIKKAITGAKGGMKRVGEGKPAATRATLKVVAVAPMAIVGVAVASAASGRRGQKNLQKARA